MKACRAKRGKWQCELAARAHGLCSGHAQRKRKGRKNWNTPLKVLNRNVGKKCKVALCPDPAHCKGLCRLHYQREWSDVDLLAPARRRLRGTVRVQAMQIQSDIVAACHAEADARGLTFAGIFREVVSAGFKARQMNVRKKSQIPTLDPWARQTDASEAA